MTGQIIKHQWVHSLTDDIAKKFIEANDRSERLEA